MPYYTRQLILHAVAGVTWLPSGRVWYRTRTAAGCALIVVDPARNSRQTVFTAQEFPARLPDSTADQHGSQAVFDTLSLGPDERTVRLRIGSEEWGCTPDRRQWWPLPVRDVNAARSPDGRQEAFVRDYNLWLREVATGQETQLTTDGVPDFGYATDTIADRHTNRAVVLWSPDSMRIATYQQDQRGVGEMYLVRTQRRHPRLDAWKHAMPGDGITPMIHRVVIDVTTRHLVRLKMPLDFVRSTSWFGMAGQSSGRLEAQWSDDSAQVAFVSIARDYKCARACVADAASGEVRVLLEERSPTYYHSALSYWHAKRADDAPNWRYLRATDELIWYSTRDDWAHLYLYDARTGALKRRLTSGAWNVVSLLRVDEHSRVLYLSAVGREPGRHPYYEHCYRVDFDGHEPMLLTPEDAAHEVSIAPDGEHLVDSYSRPDAPPVAVLRDARGQLVRTLERADISRLVTRGWRPPVPITVRARDDVTELHGLMFKPSHLDEARKYPMINAIYSGPLLGSVIPLLQDANQWGTFAPAHGLLGDAQSLAELGFIVVMIDGLGTPLRSRAFHDAHRGDYGDATLPDQIAGMQQLAQKYGWIDLERVGIYGHSHGGYAAARALLAYPDFFKVGVAIAGNHDPLSGSDAYGEKFMRVPVQRADGTLDSDDDQTNLHLARNLQGRLLLAHGGLDDNVPPYQTFRLAQALIEANKDFDLLVLPNQTHEIEQGAAGRYLIRRYWDYFVRHLLGMVPPDEYRMRAAPCTEDPVAVPTDEIAAPPTVVSSNS